MLTTWFSEYYEYLRQHFGLNEAIGAGLIFGWWGIKRFKDIRELIGRQ